MKIYAFAKLSKIILEIVFENQIEFTLLICGVTP